MLPELARSRWVGDVVFGGYGARIGVRFADHDLGAQLALRPSPGVRPAAAGKVDRMLSVFRSNGRYWIYADDEMKCQPVLRADLLDAFAIHLPAGASDNPEVLARVAFERQAQILRMGDWLFGGWG